MVNNLKDGMVTSVFGKRGMGKTSFIREALPGIPRFIAWDTKGTDYNGLGYAEFNNLSELFRYIQGRAERGLVFRAVYTSLDKDEAGELEKVCMIVNAMEDITLIVEEVDQYASPQFCPFELKRVIKLGRARGINAVCVSQRPAEVPRIITSQSNRFICFGMTEGTDIKYLSGILGSEADSLPNLEKFEYIDWQEGIITRRKLTMKGGSNHDGERIDFEKLR